MMGARLHEYASREALAEALASGIGAVLAGSLSTKGSAVLAVSGGSTPKLFFECLAAAPIDWAGVTILLVDERWVPDGDERSNASLVRRHLMQGPAAAATLVPLYREGETPTSAAPDLSRAIGGLDHPFDVVVLGMGTDGHTASFFPGAADLDAALRPAAGATVVAQTAPGAAEPRITLTLPRLAEARFLALHIEGDEKRAVLQRARDDGPVADMPVRAVLRHARADPLQIFWAP